MPVVVTFMMFADRVTGGLFAVMMLVFARARRVHGRNG